MQTPVSGCLAYPFSQTQANTPKVLAHNSFLPGQDDGSLVLHVSGAALVTCSLSTGRTVVNESLLSKI